MMALFVWWFALPAIARRLMGAVLVCGVIAAAILAYGAHRASSGYALGYTRARDSVWVAEMRKRVVLQDSLERVADSAAKAARATSAPLNSARVAFAATPRHTPRFELLPDSLSRLPRADVVRVIVENTGDTIEAVPRLAAQYWFRSDSMLGVAQRLLAKYAAANAGWANAYTAEKQAREGADSLAALWRERALNIVAPPKQSHARRDAVFATIGATVALIAKHQLHR